MHNGYCWVVAIDGGFTDYLTTRLFALLNLGRISLIPVGLYLPSLHLGPWASYRRFIDLWYPVDIPIFMQTLGGWKIRKRFYGQSTILPYFNLETKWICPLKVDFNSPVEIIYWVPSINSSMSSVHLGGRTTTRAELLLEDLSRIGNKSKKSQYLSHSRMCTEIAGNIIIVKCLGSKHIRPTHYWGNECQPD